MKKHIFIPLLIAAILVSAYFVFYDELNNQIPIIDGMYFNMSPKQAEKILGKHVEMKFDSGVTGKYIYTYKTVVFDKNATVICYFINDRNLTDMYINWEGNIEGIRPQVRDSIYDCYHLRRYFFERTSTSVTSVEKDSSIGTDNGNIGNFFYIYETPERLSVSCIFLR